jgi:hypothetical protein
MASLLPLSRELATTLTVGNTPRSAGRTEATAGAIHVVLAVLARLATAVDDRDAYEDLAREEDRTRHDALVASGGLATETVYIDPRALMGDLHATRVDFVASWARIGRVRLGLAGRRRGVAIRQVQGDAIEGRDRDVMEARVDASLAFAAYAYGDPGGDAEDAIVWWDSAAVARMRSRFSPVAYLRAVAWLDRPQLLPSEWKAHATAAGALSLEIPIGEAAGAVGVEGYEHPSALDRDVVKAVREDLATAGIRWEGHIVRNRRGEAIALRLVVAHAKAAPKAKGPRKVRERLPLDVRAARRAIARPKVLPPGPDGAPAPVPVTGFGLLVQQLDGQRAPREHPARTAPSRGRPGARTRRR